MAAPPINDSNVAAWKAVGKVHAPEAKSVKDRECKETAGEAVSLLLWCGGLQHGKHEYEWYPALYECHLRCGSCHSLMYPTRSRVVHHLTMEDVNEWVALGCSEISHFDKLAVITGLTETALEEIKDEFGAIFKDACCQRLEYYRRYVRENGGRLYSEIVTEIFALFFERTFKVDDNTSSLKKGFFYFIQFIGIFITILVGGSVGVVADVLTLRYFYTSTLVKNHRMKMDTDHPDLSIASRKANLKEKLGKLKNNIEEKMPASASQFVSPVVIVDSLTEHHVFVRGDGETPGHWKWMPVMTHGISFRYTVEGLRRMEDMEKSPLHSNGIGIEMV